MSESNKTPRYLWLYWSQGAKHAPAVVKKCLASWKKNNPGWKIILLDTNNIGKYIKLHDLCKNKTHLQMAHQSDLIRLQLLERYGGVWADATTFCRQPLDEWIDDACQSGFFAFHKPAPDRIMSNWFLAAHKGNHIPQIVFKSLTKYFKKHKDYPYFIFHHIFEELSASDQIFKDIWANTPKISAVPPHLLFHAGLLKPMTEEIQEKILNSNAPLFKLSWKFDEAQMQPTSIIHSFLFAEDTA